MARTISAGGVISLRIQFKDDLGVPSEAQNVKVFIFEPGVDTSDNSLAVVPAGSDPVYLGEGVYEYQYTTPCATGNNSVAAGDWSDKWVGDLVCQTGLTTTLVFSVTAEASEVVSFEGSQLSNNNLVTVTLLPGIASTAGEVFTEAIELEFFTDLSPYYTSVRKVKLEVGSLVTEIKDLTSAMAILEASIEADALTFSTTELNSELFKYVSKTFLFTSAIIIVFFVSNILINLKY